jgi:hypothetical protein
VTFDLVDPTAGWSDGSGCQGVHAFSDISAGAHATLYDSHGTVVATTRLKAGSATSGETCEFVFWFGSMPLPDKSYQIQVGNRGRFTEPPSQLVTSGYPVQYSLR